MCLENVDRAGLGSLPHSSTDFCRRGAVVRVQCTSLKSRRVTKTQNNTKTLLSEDQMPRQWYNIISDLPRPPPPPLHPGTLQPLQPQDLASLFPMALIQQEATMDRFVDIPDEVREVYKLWRPSPLFRYTLKPVTCNLGFMVIRQILRKQ